MSGLPHPPSSVDHSLQNCPCYLIDPRIHREKPSPFHTCMYAVYSTAVLEMLRKCTQLIYNHFLEIKDLKILGRVGEIIFLKKFNTRGYCNTAHAAAHIWRSEDNVGVGPSHYWVLGYTQVIRFGRWQVPSLAEPSS